MPDPTRRIFELPIADAPLSAKEAVLVDKPGEGSESRQTSLQALISAGLRLLGLPSQLQRIDPVTGAGDLPAPSNPNATLGPLAENAVDPLDGIPVIRRNSAVFPVPIVEQVPATKIGGAIPAATPFERGIMSAADKANLDALVSGGGGSALPNQLSLGRILTGPTTTDLAPADDGGYILQCDASAGDIIINVLPDIPTPSAKKFVGGISKRGAGKIIFQTAGTPGVRPSVIASDVYKQARGNNTDPISAQTFAYDHPIPTGGNNCTTYFFMGALPNATGAAGATLGLFAALDPAAASTGPVAWAKSDYPDVGAVEPFGQVVLVAHKVWGTLADGANINIDVAVPTGWRSYVLFAVTVKDVPADKPLEAALTEVLSVSTPAISVSPDIVVPKANQLVLSAAWCRSGLDGAASVVTTDATQIENDNSGTSGTVTTHTRGAMAIENGVIGVVGSTFTFPSSQQHGYAIATIPAIESSAVALIVPNNAAPELAGVNQYYGWTYDGNANELEII